jgi:hypothetical protein
MSLQYSACESLLRDLGMSNDRHCGALTVETEVLRGLVSSQLLWNTKIYQRVVRNAD